MNKQGTAYFRQQYQYPRWKTYRSRYRQSPTKSMGIPVRKSTIECFPINYLQPNLQRNINGSSWRILWLCTVLRSDWSRQNFYDDRCTIRLQVQGYCSQASFFSLSRSKLQIWASHKGFHFLPLTLQWNFGWLAWRKQQRSTDHSGGSKRVRAGQGTYQKTSR